MRFVHFSITFYFKLHGKRRINVFQNTQLIIARLLTTFIFLPRDRAFGLPQYHGSSNEIAPHIGTVPQVVLRASPYLVTSSVFSFHNPPGLLSDGIEELILSDPQLLASIPCALAACFVG